MRYARAVISHRVQRSAQFHGNLTHIHIQHKKMPQNHSIVIRAGWLTKKNVNASFFDNWKPRYFILQKSGHLTYFSQPPFEDSSAQNRKGCCLVGSRSSFSAVSTEQFSKENVMRIRATWQKRHNTKTQQTGDLYVQAASEEDLQGWIEALRPFTRSRRNCVTASDKMLEEPPEVLNSNFVQILSTPPDDAKRADEKKLSSRPLKAYEVITTEEKYLKDLKMCMTVYHDAMVSMLNDKKKSRTLLSRLFSRKSEINFTRDDVTAMFGQMELLIKFSSELLVDLKKCVPGFVLRVKKEKETREVLKIMSEKQATEMCFQIAAVFIKYTPFMLFYTTYANNFATSQATLRRLRRQDTFKNWLFERRSQSDDLGLSDFLIKPVQRLLRYKLLLRDMQKLTDAFHEDFDELSLAILKLDVVAAAVDSVTSKHGHELLNDRSSVRNIHSLIKQKQLLHSSSSRSLMSQSSSSLLSVDKKHVVKKKKNSSLLPPPPRAPSSSDVVQKKKKSYGNPSVVAVVEKEEDLESLKNGVVEKEENVESLTKYEKTSRMKTTSSEKKKNSIKVTNPSKKNETIKNSNKTTKETEIVTKEIMEKLEIKKSSKLDIKRETLEDGTIIETWPNGRITRRCLSGDTHTKLPDGTEKISNSQGASRTTRPDGSWTQIDMDGTEVTQLADGTKTFKLPSGQTLVNYPDGRRIQRNPDGTTITRRTDGVQIATLPNGVVNTRYPDGHVVQIELDGTKIERLKDGVVVTYLPDGIIIAKYKDGHTIQRNVDGSKIESFTDGRVEQTSSCGRYMTKRASDGTTTTVRVKPGILDESIEHLLVESTSNKE